MGALPILDTCNDSMCLRWYRVYNILTISCHVVPDARQLAFNSCLLSLETIGRKKVVHNMKLYLPMEGERVCDCVEVRVSE